MVCLMFLKYRRTFSLYENLFYQCIKLSICYLIIMLICIHYGIYDRRTTIKLDNFVSSVIFFVILSFIIDIFKTSGIYVTPPLQPSISSSLWDNKMFFVFGLFFSIICVQRILLQHPVNSRSFAIPYRNLTIFLMTLVIYVIGICLVSFTVYSRLVTFCKIFEENATKAG